MLIYWLLFAYPAVLALAYPDEAQDRRGALGQWLAAALFVVFYTLVSGLREEVGGDWLNYLDIFDDIRYSNLSYAMTATEPLYGLLNWLSAQFDTGIYPVNAACSFLLAVGVVQVAARFRDPWLAVLMAVPYLLIVVGMGYVRQGAAIGLILIAIAAYEQKKTPRMVIALLLAVGFHTAAVVAFPLFAYALTQRHKLMAVAVAVLGSAVWLVLVLPRLAAFDAGYLQAEYESSGALTRIMMNFLPSVLLLLRWRQFAVGGRSRSIWISLAIANVATMAALVLSPSSTAVDRIGLFFSIIQAAVIGEFRNLVPFGRRDVWLVRFALIGLAAFVQVVWLVYATNANSWVPYQSILD